MQINKKKILKILYITNNTVEKEFVNGPFDVIC